MAEAIDLEGLVDHHCHGLVLDALDRAAFEALMNEATAPSPGTTFFDSMLGLAVRRWCAPVLGLDRHASAETYLARRRELGVEASRRLVAAAGIETFLVDIGIGAGQLCAPTQLAGLVGGTAYEVVRLETLAETLLRRGVPAGRFADEIGRALRASPAVAAKSIAAYRVGLDLPAQQPTPTALVAALRSQKPDPAGDFRLAHPVINGWLAWTAVDLGLPLQIHVGLGDRDVDLGAADPLRLTAFLRATEERGVPVLLLHNYPFHRHAGYLAQVFGHVYLDVGLALHNTGALSDSVIREALELAPFAKVLFSSDAYGLAELYHLGALLFRRGLDAVLGRLVDTDEMASADARNLGALVTRENARRVYRL